MAITSINSYPLIDERTVDYTLWRPINIRYTDDVPTIMRSCGYIWNITKVSFQFDGIEPGENSSVIFVPKGKTISSVTAGTGVTISKRYYGSSILKDGDVLRIYRDKSIPNKYHMIFITH